MSDSLGVYTDLTLVVLLSAAKGPDIDATYLVIRSAPDIAPNQPKCLVFYRAL